MVRTVNDIKQIPIYSRSVLQFMQHFFSLQRKRIASGHICAWLSLTQLPLTSAPAKRFRHRLELEWYGVGWWRVHTIFIFTPSHSHAGLRYVCMVNEMVKRELSN